MGPKGLTSLFQAYSGEKRANRTGVKEFCYLSVLGLSPVHSQHRRVRQFIGLLLTWQAGGGEGKIGLRQDHNRLAISSSITSVAPPPMA